MKDKRLYAEAVDRLGPDMAMDKECAFCGSEEPELADWVACLLCGDTFCSQECEEDHRVPGAVPQCSGSKE